MSANDLSCEQESALRAMQSYYDLRLDSGGGYPAEIDGVTIPGWVVVADIEGDCEPSLQIYPWTAVLTWYRNALTLLKEEEDPDYYAPNHVEEKNGAEPGIALAMSEARLDA